MVRFYRLLLYAFPAAFRRRFGDDMTALFHDRLRAARREGSIAVSALVARTIVDVLAHGLRERRASSRPSMARGIVGITQDVLFTLRLFRQRPAFPAAATATLALGIGANLAIFSAVRAVLIDELPYSEPDRIVHLSQVIEGVLEPGLSLDHLAALGAGAPALERVAGSQLDMVVARGDDAAEQVVERIVTGDFFAVFGVRPSMGRPLTPDDAGTQVAVISHRLWQSQFHGAADVIGRVIHAGNVSYSIVGVMPNDFAPQFSADLSVMWRPVSAAENKAWFTTFARLTPEVTIEQARSQVETVMRPLGREVRFVGKDVRRYLGMSVERLGETEARYARSGLLLLQGIAALLLLVACANVANLSLANATARRRELILRTALGASRGRLVRQLLTESTVIAMAGALAGMGVALLAAPALFSLLPPSVQMPRGLGGSVELPELAVGLGVGIMCAYTFGVVPALLASRGGLLLREAHGTGSRAARLFRSSLVAGQVLVALVGLTGAGLLIKSFVNVLSLPLGFDPRGLVVGEFMLASTTGASVDNANIVDRLAADARSRFRGHAIAIGYGVPHATTWSSGDWIVGTTWDSDRGKGADSHSASAGFFETLGMPVLRGRGFGPDDVRGSPPVAVVNETFEREFGGRSLVGASITSRAKTTYIVIGVVGDTRRGTREPRAAVYTALAQRSGIRNVQVAIRTASAASAARELRELVRTIDPQIAIIAIDTMNERIAKDQAQRRFYLAMLSLFAGLAGMLAAVGIYSVTSHVTASRTRELGVRLALGAVPGEVVSLVLRQNLIPIVAGLVAGLVAAAWSAGLLERNVTFTSLLFEVTPHDAATYAVVTAGLLVVGLFACLVPARRASRLDPARVLRTE
jgi:putative ABC transport system permease protein